MATVRIPTVFRLLLLVAGAGAGFLLWNLLTAERADAAVELPLPKPIADPVDEITAPLPPLPVEVTEIPAPPLPVAVPEIIDAPGLPDVLGPAPAPPVAAPATVAPAPRSPAPVGDDTAPEPTHATTPQSSDDAQKPSGEDRQDPPTRPVSDTGESPSAPASATPLSQLAVLGAVAAFITLAVREWLRASRIRRTSLASGRLERPG